MSTENTIFFPFTLMFFSYEYSDIYKALTVSMKLTIYMDIKSI